MTQRERMIQLLEDRTMARATELQEAGVSATAVSRSVETGEVIRVSRGLYQLPEAAIDASVTLAEASKRVPKGTICLISALAYHGLTDQMPRKVWIAIGAKDWQPTVEYPPLRIVRFRSPYLEYGIEWHTISSVEVPIYSIEKSLADGFRNSKLLDQSVAIECLRNAVTRGKSTPAEIAEVAINCGAWRRMRPYLEAVI